MIVPRPPEGALRSAHADFLAPYLRGLGGTVTLSENVYGVLAERGLERPTSRRRSTTSPRPAGCGWRRPRSASGPSSCGRGRREHPPNVEYLGAQGRANAYGSPICWVATTSTIGQRANRDTAEDEREYSRSAPAERGSRPTKAKPPALSSTALGGETLQPYITIRVRIPRELHVAATQAGRARERTLSAEIRYALKRQLDAYTNEAPDDDGRSARTAGETATYGTRE